MQTRSRLDLLTTSLAAAAGSEVCSGRQRANNHAASIATGGELGIVLRVAPGSRSDL